MRKILILDQNESIAEQLKSSLAKDRYQVVIAKDLDWQHAASYRPFLRNVTTIVSLLGPMDVDLDFEALFDAIHQVQPPLKRFVMLSSAGISHEVNGSLKYPGVTDVKEYLNEQRYSVKVVDEEEIPYTILRPVDMVSGLAKPVQIVSEGHRVPAGQVSCGTMVDIILKSITDHRYIGQSIAIINR